MPTTPGKKRAETKTVTSAMIRDCLCELMNRVRDRSERFRVTRHGKPVMALVPLEDLEFMEQVLDAIEDEIDLPVIRERLRDFEETGGGMLWRQIKAERGL